MALSGERVLQTAVRLKVNFVTRMRMLPAEEWPAAIADFAGDLLACGLNDWTALATIILSVGEELRDLPPAATISASPTTDDVTIPLQDHIRHFDQKVLDALIVLTPRAGRGLGARAAAFIDDHYERPLTVAELAASLGRHRTALRVRFRKEIGMTVRQYLTRVRIIQAANMIRQGDKIEAVALLVGYRSKKNFYRQFRAIMGVPPGAFRVGNTRAMT